MVMVMMMIIMRTSVAGSNDCGLCVLGRGPGEDSIEHYAHCNSYWEFVFRSRPQGLGLSQRFRSREAFFLIHE
eukprot:12431072-Karenia_brevis.AAC.1